MKRVLNTTASTCLRLSSCLDLDKVLLYTCIYTFLPFASNYEGSMGDDAKEPTEGLSDETDEDPRGEEAQGPSVAVSLADEALEAAINDYDASFRHRNMLNSAVGGSAASRRDFDNAEEAAIEAARAAEVAADKAATAAKAAQAAGKSDLDKIRKALSDAKIYRRIAQETRDGMTGQSSGQVDEATTRKRTRDEEVTVDTTTPATPKDMAVVPYKPNALGTTDTAEGEDNDENKRRRTQDFTALIAEYSETFTLERSLQAFQAQLATTIQENRTLNGQIQDVNARNQYMWSALSRLFSESEKAYKDSLWEVEAWKCSYKNSETRLCWI